MRFQIDNPISTWLIFLLFIVPVFIASLKPNRFSWDLRITIWIVMAVSVYVLCQYYLVQGGSFYGKGILG